MSDATINPTQGCGGVHRRRSARAVRSVETCQECRRVSYMSVGQNLCDTCQRRNVDRQNIEVNAATGTLRAQRRAALEVPAAPAAPNNRQARARRGRRRAVINLDDDDDGGVAGGREENARPRAQVRVAPYAAARLHFHPSQQHDIDLLRILAGDTAIRIIEARLLAGGAHFAALDARLAAINREQNIFEVAINRSLQDYRESNRKESALQKKIIQEACETQLVETTVPKGLIGESCAICLDAFEADGKTILLKCTHAFHKPCLTTWIPTNNACPMCRTPCIDSPEQ